MSAARPVRIVPDSQAKDLQETAAWFVATMARTVARLTEGLRYVSPDFLEQVRQRGMGRLRDSDWRQIQAMLAEGKEGVLDSEQG